jgi:hypothetical protein
MYTDYQVITDYSLEHLEQNIIKLMGEGWQPTGGISTVLYNNNPDEFKDDEGFDTIMYSQAIVK